MRYEPDDPESNDTSEWDQDEFDAIVMDNHRSYDSPHGCNFRWSRP